jgi:hypothetical protein
MPCLLHIYVYVYVRLGMASHVFFADKSSDDRVCGSFGDLVIGLTVFCRGFGY